MRYISLGNKRYIDIFFILPIQFLEAKFLSSIGRCYIATNQNDLVYDRLLSFIEDYKI
jgi:hypothetical protein